MSPIFIKNILKIEKNYRKIILLILDYFFTSSSLFLCRLILSENQFFILSNLEIFIFSSIVVIVYSSTSLYRGLTRYTEGSSFVYELAIKNLITLILLLSFKEINLNITWKFIFLSWILLTVSISVYRIIIRDTLQELLKFNRYNKTLKKKKIAIFGTEMESYQIYRALNLSEKYDLKYFIDDKSSLYGKYIFKKKIITFKNIEQYSSDIEQIFVSLTSLNSPKNKRLISKLNLLDLDIMVIPSIDDIGLNTSLVDQLRPISINDLLGRTMVIPDKKLLKKGVEGFVLLITGAGGSIGSQLSKEISMLGPKELILIDNSEYNLYKIEQDILNIKNLNVKTTSYLGNICDEDLVRSIFKKHSVDIVFHAAAYKHVPLVEKNPIVGIENNLLSTISVCEAAKMYSIKQVIFISSDKSVRPTNIMGASKRLSEMVIQSYAEQENASSTCFSMVRFGNVLGSSGSVIPLFKKQISEGGPVTVTDPNVVRYFMTVKEAAQLVIQASSLAKGGEVFLLDMGKPIKIRDLAEQIINLSGKTLKDQKNPDGDIEIKFIGLREGEKLYEELLIDSKSVPTKHPLIYYGNESFIGNQNFIMLLDKLKIALKEKKIDETFSILSKLVPDWHYS